MAHDKRWRLVCYDVRDPRQHRKVLRIVKGYGRSVQYSVFRCRLDDREMERLRWELSKVMAPEDALLVVDLCPSCASRVVARNTVDGWIDDEPTFMVVPQPTHGPAAVGPSRPAGRRKSSEKPKLGR